MRTFLSLFAASIVGSLAFALPWLRFAHLVSSAETALRLFLEYGVIILVLTLTAGAAMIALAKALGILRWWSCTGAGLVLGGLLGGMLTVGGIMRCSDVRRNTASQETCVQNPFALTFSPISRDSPGFTEQTPQSPADFVGSLTLGMLVGGAIGASFYLFYSSRSRSNLRWGGP
jgi:hypothetical protein